MSVDEQPTFSFDQEGHLTLDFGPFNHDWREALCCECNEPIRWVLDMFSFKHNDKGGYDLGHAWCLWLPSGFDTAKKRAKKKDKVRR